MATVRQRRARWVQGNQDDRRATRAFHFVQMGELSSGRQGLKGEELAPGNEETLKELRKRVAIHATPCRLCHEMHQFSIWMRGSSGRTISDDEGSSSTPLGGQIPESTASTIRRGRMTALRKDGGGVRGIVAGEVIRRVTARTIAQQLGPAVEVSTAPSARVVHTRAISLEW